MKIVFIFLTHVIFLPVNCEDCREEGWAYYSEKKIYVTMMKGKSTTCNKVNEVCKSLLGGRALMIRDKETNSIVEHYLNSTAANVYAVLIGLQNIGHKGVYHWADGTPLNTSEWANWGPGQPTAGKGCAALKLGAWYFNHESTQRKFLCQCTVSDVGLDKSRGLKTKLESMLSHNETKLNDSAKSNDKIKLNRDELDGIMSTIDEITQEINETSVSEEIGTNTLDVINKMAGCCINEFKPEKRRELVTYIDRVATGTQLDPGNSFSFKSTHITLLVQDISTTQPRQKSHFVLEIPTSSLPNVTSAQRRLPSTVDIPLDRILESLSDAEKPTLTRISLVVYKDDSMFSDNKTVGAVTNIVSSVISVDIPGLSVRNLDEKVMLTFRPDHQKVAPSCVFWKHDGEKGYYWDDEGCSVVEYSPEFVKCGCNHLTNYALLLVVDESTLKEHKLTLDIVSIIGSLISIVSLIVTLLSYSMFPSLSRNARSIIVLNLCFTLLMSNIINVAKSIIENGHGFTGFLIVCKLLAIFMHFFILSSMMWVSCDAFLLSQKIVGYDMRKDNDYAYKFVLVSWYIPAIVVLLTCATPPLENYRFINGDECWIKTPVIYYAVAMPVAFLMLFNCVILGVVFYYIRKHPSSTSKKRIIIIKQMKGSVSLTVLLFLTWGFGFVGSGSAQVVISHVFVLFSSLQGFFVFICLCVLNSEFRDLCMGRVREEKHSELSEEEISSFEELFTLSNDDRRPTIQLKESICASKPC